MQVHVRYFAVLRERAGRSEDTVQIDPGTTATELYRVLFPPGPDGSLPVMFAVNQVYVPGDQQLCDGDELAFIPPLGGG